MLFNSIEFLIFLPLVLISYFLLPHRFRWLLLLVASYVFYMFWEWKYLSLILLSTLVDYVVALKLATAKTKTLRKFLLGVSLSSNLGILVFFKYANFFIENANQLLQTAGMEYMMPYTSFLLPMGISFYTFQTMAYTIDVYLGKAQVERHFGYFALYVSYFPQLVAGPIERAQNLLSQLKAKVTFDSSNMIFGTKLLIWGLFKKMVIADRLGTFVSHVYDQPHEPSGLLVGLATFFFAIQIYCDFSGYTDIAIGVARMFGVKLMDNFRTPYLSQSISEFWSRWHISLSTWFRDYLYIPLGGNRVQKSRWIMNIMIVFVVSGFWHGANWTFIIWGGLHGVYLLAERFLSTSFSIKWLKQVSTFLLVCLAWLFFRSADLNHSIALLSEFSSPNAAVAKLFLYEFGLGEFAVLVIVLLSFLLIDPIIDKRHKTELRLNKSDVIVYASVLVAIMLFGNFGEVSFIYFQF